MKKLILGFVFFSSAFINGQQIEFLELPSLFEREFEISGMTGDATHLYLAAERCAKVFVLDKENVALVETIELDTSEIESLEVEGLSRYKDYLLLTDEKKGRIFSYHLKTKQLTQVNHDQPKFSKFRGNYGMEGIAIDTVAKVAYVLRERNKDNESEIHSFDISEKQAQLKFKYRNQTRLKNKNKDWRYSGIAIDQQNKRLLCIRSYYVGHASVKNKREVHVVPIKVLKKKKTNSKILVSVSEAVFLHRNSFATNVEGIYADMETIYITADNGKGIKDCSQISKKTPLIRIEFPN